jgi:uncharacterized protein DUF3303
MALYGVFGTHTPEACPLNNPVNRKDVIEMSEKLSEVAQEHHVELKHQFHSALEHNFVWIVDAENGHIVQKFLIELEWSKFNTMKIFPVGTFKTLVEELRKIEQV